MRIVQDSKYRLGQVQCADLVVLSRYWVRPNDRIEPVWSNVWIGQVSMWTMDQAKRRHCARPMLGLNLSCVDLSPLNYENKPLIYRKQNLASSHKNIHPWHFA